MTTCRKTGCSRRTFMDTDRCFDHQQLSVGFRLWIAFCALIGIAMTGLLAWVVVTLVQWVTAR